MSNTRQERRAFESWRRSTSTMGDVTTRDRRRYRRRARAHAKNCEIAGLVERALVWRKRARNG